MIVREKKIGIRGSLPARGVWIEIAIRSRRTVPSCRSLPARGVWIEIRLTAKHTAAKMSLPARGVWIEMT